MLRHLQSLLRKKLTINCNRDNHDNNIYNLPWGETHHGVKKVEKKESNSKEELVKEEVVEEVKEEESE